MAKVLFPLGQIVATPGVLDELARAKQSPQEFLARHASGDWGDLRKGDKNLNDEALENEGRLLSAYLLRNGVRIWVITEADRSATTVLLPEEY